MGAPLLYTALADNLSLRNMGASWPWPAGKTAPLNPDNPFTQRMLADGSIRLADPGAVDDTTPPNTLRGIPGMKVAVSN